LRSQGLATKTRELILDSVKERFNLELERKQDLDSKANNLIGFVAIILSLISGFGLTTLTNDTLPKLEPTWYYVTKISPIFTFVIVYMLLFFSVLFVLKALQIKNYSYVPNAFNLIGAFENSNEDDVCQALYDEFAISIKTNSLKNDKEAFDIRKSIYFLLLALLLFSISVLLFVFVGR
jgi:hypothetical protein